MDWWLWVLLTGLLIGLLYWLFVLTEGAYLGAGTVIRLYDRYAGRYDDIKQFDAANEVRFLGQPLLEAVKQAGQEGETVRMLDVAAGTGRVAVALASTVTRKQYAILLDSGHIARPPACQMVVLDGSDAMLRQAARSLAHFSWPDVTLMHHQAAPLPFDDGEFQIVTCLEALEFMPDPAAVIAEALRVLAPGGLLMLTNRIGWQSRFMPGKAFSRQDFADLLRSSGAVVVQTAPWQMDYDLVTARKAS